MVADHRRTISGAGRAGAEVRSRSQQRALASSRSQASPPTATPPPTRRQQSESALDVQALVADHAPKGWKKEIAAGRLASVVKSGEAIDSIVLAADIRSSTHLMKEAVDFRMFARIIGEFTRAAGAALRKKRGWYDKFTGDGFLAYWIADKRDVGTYLGEVLGACDTFLQVFEDKVANDLRANSKNFPAKAGLSLGIDAGPAHLVTVAGALTIVGSPVVGAVRMVGIATEPYTTFANVYIGEMLYRDRYSLLGKHGISVQKEVRSTKEYDAGQEVYSVGFKRPAVASQDGANAG